MPKRDPIQMAKMIAVKRLRNRARLEAQLLADKALNEILPEFEALFENALATGEAYELESYEAWVAESVHAAITSG